MIINSLCLKGFRNLKNCNIDTNADIIILKGENGQGKTNLLEAVYALCYGSSFRTQNIREMICAEKKEEGFYIKSSYTDDKGIPRETEFSYNGVCKSIKMDKIEIRDRKELIYSIPCIVFSHEDIEIVRGEPEYRRRFFDQTLTMYDSVFFDNLRHYRNILRQRNSCIKDGRTDLIELYDDMLIYYGVRIMNSREEVCNSFSAIFPDIYREVSMTDDYVTVNYRPSWDLSIDEKEIKENIRNQLATDIKMGTTTSGPHRDRFVITGKNGVFANTASTGQIRLASLIMRSAQAAYFRLKTSENPVFLVDDVLLELDSERRSRYLQCLGQYSQAFFTFLPKENYFSSDLGNSLMYNVVDGVFYEQEKL